MSRGRTTRVLTRRVDTDGNRRVPDDLIVGKTHVHPPRR
ncbi:MAG: hypothetical protein CM1200mP26_04280 [Acidimicrobiales bacterium]|nr:MAG: hypothetical protein CM1200mP26_04280 [Acidimicrobiales bacterium]